MTTVVFRNGIMASDSLGVQSGNTKLPGAFQKLWIMQDGTLVGCAGDYHSVTSCIIGAMAVSEIRVVNSYDASEILCARPDGLLRLATKGQWVELGSPEFYAIGSGQTAALSALHLGSSAHDAIRAASLVDVFTDDRIQTVEFGARARMPIVPVPQYTPTPEKPQKLSLLKRLFG